MIYVNDYCIVIYDLILIIFHYSINERALKIVDNNITEINAEAVNTYFESLSSPRCFKTHLPLTLLPPSLLNTSKMIYIARDPRDVVVSSYYYYKIQRGLEFNGNLKTMLDQFQEDYSKLSIYLTNIKITTINIKKAENITIKYN